MRVPLPLIGPSYPNRSLPLSAQVCKGFYPEFNQESRSILSLNPFPGLKEFSQLGTTGRGMDVMSGILYAVSGDSLYKVNSNGDSTNEGYISGNGMCDLANNGSQLVITTGDQPYFYNGTLAPISDPDLVKPTVVDYLNNQFIYDQNSGTPGEFITSDVGDGTSVDALSFAVAESHPDDIERIIVHSEVAHMFGKQSDEPWFNSGTGLPPFERISGGVRPYGLAGKWAVATSDDFIYFLDSKRIPRRMQGISVTPIGNPALGNEWANYDRVDDAIGMTYTLDQQNFFQLTFPSADRTWLYHEQSNMWCQLSDGVNNARHRSVSYAYAYDKHIVQDHSNGKLYELDFDTYTDNGQPILRQRATATIHGGLYDAPGATLFFDYVEFIVQTGEGLNLGQGQNPLLMVRHSDDGGRTWSAEEHYELGRGGKYLTTVELYCQGSAEQRIYELSVSDPIPVTLISAHADISVGL